MVGVVGILIYGWHYQHRLILREKIREASNYVVEDCIPGLKGVFEGNDLIRFCVSHEISVALGLKRFISYQEIEDLWDELIPPSLQSQ